MPGGRVRYNITPYRGGGGISLIITGVILMELDLYVANDWFMQHNTML